MSLQESVPEEAVVRPAAPQNNAINNNEQQQQPCILTLHGLTLDVSEWDHPGGSAVLRRYHGRDATQAFEAAGHSDAARSMLGVLADDQYNIDARQQHAKRQRAALDTRFAPGLGGDGFVQSAGECSVKRKRHLGFQLFRPRHFGLMKSIG